MPKITKIETQKRKGRFNIYVDGEFVVGIGDDLLVQEGIEVGKVINPRGVQKLVYKSKVEKLFDKALNLLGYRPRSKQEIRNKLWQRVAKLKIQKELREDLIRCTLDQLEERGYLDDKKFAKWWVKERIRSRPRGKLLLRSELFKKGIERKVIDEVLREYSQNDEISWAERIAEKRESRHETLEPEKKREKMAAYLHGRGFTWEVINTVLESFR